MEAIVLKEATESAEFVQIHQLNYKTFVEEIPQHPVNNEKILIDKFHHKNRYIIAKEEGKVVGMVCYNHERPFSLDGKLDNLDGWLPNCNKLTEIRLLAIMPGKRKGRLAYDLMHHLFDVVISQGADAAIISGTTDQLKLYRHIGFKPFGPLVGKSGAQFQPMYITLKDISSGFKY